MSSQKAFVQQVAVVDVVEALSSLMRQSNRMERIKSSDIVDKMAVQHGVPALVSCCWFTMLIAHVDTLYKITIHSYCCVLPKVEQQRMNSY